MIEDLKSEIRRAERLAELYGSTGHPWMRTTMYSIRKEVEYARQAICINDAAGMRHWLQSLREFQK